MTIYGTLGTNTEFLGRRNSVALGSTERTCALQMLILLGIAPKKDTYLVLYSHQTGMYTNFSLFKMLEILWLYWITSGGTAQD